jgi:hypothetical protein
VVGDVTKKLDDAGFKTGAGTGSLDDLKTKLGKPGNNPADDIDLITGKKKIPCYSSLGKQNQTPLDYAVAFLFGGIRAEACGEDVVFEPKIQKQIIKRGWTEDQVNELVKNPKKTKATVDKRYMPDNSGTRNDPATAYFDDDGNYVVVNDTDNTIVQISDKLDPDWIIPDDLIGD